MLLTAGGEVSSYLAIKGVFSESTFRICREWNLAIPAKENFREIENTNPIGASSSSWLKEFVSVLKRRFDFDGSDKVLIDLAKDGWLLDEWKAIQLWHAVKKDVLLRHFLQDWLYVRNQEGIAFITAPTVCQFLRLITTDGQTPSTGWKDNTCSRVANGLLKTACEFHLMKGRVTKQFEHYNLPERSFLHLLHQIMQREGNTKNLINAPDWRLYMMRPNDVEEELLRLHQFGKLHFERAGSFLQLTLCSHGGTEVSGRSLK